MKKILGIILALMFIAFSVCGIAEQKSLEMDEYNYDKAYRVGFDSLARYYLLDTASRTITTFTTYIDLGKETGTYTGDLKSGIDFELKGIQYHAETKYDGSILTVDSKYGSTDKGYVSDVDLIKGYWLSPETFEDEIITVKNNKEFAALLKRKNPGGPDVEKFAVKYAGRVIEFDGNIAYMCNHGSYSTRFDFLLSPGNYNKKSAKGPNFKYEDCNYYNLNLTGDNIPDSIRMGDNLHFVARIVEYKELSELFFLEPISTEAR